MATILIVEDDKAILDMLRRVLNASGYDSLETESAAGRILHDPGQHGRNHEEPHRTF